MAEPETVRESVRIAGLSGSLRAVSYTRMAVEVALRGAREVGAQVHMIDLRDYDLPLCDARKDKSTYPPGVARLRAEVSRAQGLVLGTPEYHGSLSGVLKNALDLLGFDEFEGKMIALLGVSGGRSGAWDALNSLRNVGRALHAWVLPEQVSIAEAWRLFDRSGAVLDPALETRLLEMGRQVARFAYLHSSRRSRDFVQLWEQAPVNPGGTDG